MLDRLLLLSIPQDDRGPLRVLLFRERGPPGRLSMTRDGLPPL